MSEPSNTRNRRSKRQKLDKDLDEEVPAPTTRRPLGKTKAKTGQKTAKKPVRKLKGVLQRLKDFPIDIIFEVRYRACMYFSNADNSQIFVYLTPQDLLSLSRTSKEMRSLLLDHSTMDTIWRTARGNVKRLPDKPSDMSEVAYAHLCFDTSCFVSFAFISALTLAVLKPV